MGEKESEVTRDRLLALLKDIETNGHAEWGKCACPSCRNDSYRSENLRHHEGCELKAAIDWLESTASGYDLVFVYDPGKPKTSGRSPLDRD